MYRDSYDLYAVSGILFNHESPRRQEHYVTRKITKNVARIAKSIQKNEGFKPLQLGNLDAERDWSDARDFVDGVWKMLHQEDTIKDYVLSSNETHSIREFVEKAFVNAGIPKNKCFWAGNDVEEKYYLRRIHKLISKPIPVIENHPFPMSMATFDEHHTIRKTNFYKNSGASTTFSRERIKYLRKNAV